MKIRYLLIILCIVIAVVIFVIMLKKLKKVRINNIKSIEFSYTKGYMINSNVSYKLECGDYCVATICPYGTSCEDAKEFKVDKSVLLEIENILNKYDVISWNGFNKADKNVLDGDSFSINIKMSDGGKIDASGYMMWPKNYREVKEELDKIFTYIYENNKVEDVDLKPIIYLYPESKIDVSVKLGYPDKLTVTYPKYDNGWNVTAYPDGTLTLKNTGRQLYSLFWEGVNTVSNGIREDGFIVEGKNISSFLEEKLSILGLNDREIEEFIIYWLPKMQNNKYNYIRFETKEEQDKNMPLIVNPKPDIVIRVNMEYKALDKRVSVKEQELNKAERNGFTVVEWGGTILK